MSRIIALSSIIVLAFACGAQTSDVKEVSTSAEKANTGDAVSVLDGDRLDTLIEYVLQARLRSVSAFNHNRKRHQHVMIDRFTSPVVDSLTKFHFRSDREATLDHYLIKATTRSVPTPGIPDGMEIYKYFVIRMYYTTNPDETILPLADMTNERIIKLERSILPRVDRVRLNIQDDDDKEAIEQFREMFSVEK